MAVHMTSTRISAASPLLLFSAIGNILFVGILEDWTLLTSFCATMPKISLPGLGRTAHDAGEEKSVLTFLHTSTATLNRPSCCAK